MRCKYRFRKSNKMNNTILDLSQKNTLNRLKYNQMY